MNLLKRLIAAFAGDCDATIGHGPGERGADWWLAGGHASSSRMTRRGASILTSTRSSIGFSTTP